MTLDEYIVEQHTMLDNFKQFWKAKQVESPEMFPNELKAGDWDEQFWIFDDDSPETGEKKA